MKQQKYISIIYGIFLAIGILLCIGSLIFIPVDTYTANDEKTVTELVPNEIIRLSEDVREFHFRNIDWMKNGTCLHFVSSHQEIQVEADGVLLFERKAVPTLWGHTTGFSWEYIDIPENTEEVVVTVTACYPTMRDSSLTFYQQFSAKILQDVFRQKGLSAIVSLLNLCLGIIMLVYGTAARKKSSVGKSMVYLGLFTVLLGIWSITESGLMALLFEHRAACSFISYSALAMLGIPFILFIRCYLQTDDRYVYLILLGINFFNILQMYVLQFSGIRDMKLSLPLTHLAMLAAFFYLPFSLINRIRRRCINRNFWVTVGSLLSMFPPLLYSLYVYYKGSHNVADYGNVCFFIFIIFFAIDVGCSIMKDIDAGKKAAIYQELAEKDLLTGCYNRNAYRNDTCDWTDLKDVLLLTFDLNNLKKCNDTLGHNYGDQYITDASAMLKETFSSYGKIYRIGGDEFCIIISDSHKKCDIHSLLDALIEKQQIYNASSECIRMQIACGYAEFDPKTDSNMEDIRIRADKHMYKNKKDLKRIS